MKKSFVLLVAGAFFVSLLCGCSSSNEDKHNKGPLEQYHLIGYGCVYPDFYADVLAVTADGYMEAGYCDLNGPEPDPDATGYLDDTQMTELLALLDNAGFAFAGELMEYGDAATAPYIYLLSIRGDTSDEKSVSIAGEAPADAPQEYLDLRDYLKARYEELMP